MIEELKTDYKDDVLATSQQGKRTFNIVGKNGEILFEDVHIEDTSRYLQVGDEYGQSIINEQNGAINQLAKGTGYVYDTYAEYLEAYQGGEIPNGSIVYIKEGSVDGTITALQVKYNDSNVKLALDTLGNRITQLDDDLDEVDVKIISETYTNLARQGNANFNITKSGYRLIDFNVTSTNPVVNGVCTCLLSRGYGFVYNIDNSGNTFTRVPLTSTISGVATFIKE